jgi:hypothetical protein
MYLDTTFISTKFRPDRTSNMAILENQLRAIGPKLCTYVPLGKSNSQTKFQFSLILGLATRGQNQKHKKCCNSWSNGWISSKFLSWVHLIEIHDIIPGFLIWPNFQGENRKHKSAMTPELMAGSSSCTLSGWGRVQLIEYASEDVNCEQPLTTLLELITFLACKLSHVAAGEHMFPGPFHYAWIEPCQSTGP